MMLRPITTALCLATCVMALAQGQVTWIERVHDFGTFPESLAHVTGQVRFVNTGDSALVITQVRPTCGCTASDYPRQAIMPGDTATITLTYTAMGRPGEFDKDVFVYTNGSPRRSTVTIRGKVIGSPATVSEQYPVGVGPLRLDRAQVPLGDIVRGKTRTAYISAYNTATDSVSVTFANVPSGLIPQAIPSVVAPGSTTAITVFYDSGTAPIYGLNAATFSIMASHGDGNASSQAIDVTAMVREDFSKLTPKQIDNAPVALLGQDKIDFAEIDLNGPAITKTLEIKNRGGEKLIVHRIYTTQPGVSINYKNGKIGKGKSLKVTVTLNPGQLDQTDRMLNATLNVIANDPRHPVQIVRLVGLFKKK